MDKIRIALIISSVVSGVAVGGTALGVSYKYIDKAVTENKKFDKVNNALLKKFENLDIKVKTFNNIFSLTSTYQVKNYEKDYEVNYVIESYNKISDDNKTLPESLIKREEGTDKKAGNINLKNFKIKNDIFTTYTLYDQFFNGTLSNGKKYMKTDQDLYNFDIKIYFDRKVSEIEYSYFDDDYVKTLVNIKIN